MNVNKFNGTDVPQEISEALEIRNRKLHIDYWCEGCGRCVDRCKQKALKLVEGKAAVINERCVLCGYCGSVCPQFAIKVH